MPRTRHTDSVHRTGRTVRGGCARRRNRRGPLGLALCLAVALTTAAWAQDEPASDDGVTGADDEIQRLIASMQARIDRMDKSAEETDAALRFLAGQVEGAIERLSNRQGENAALRQKARSLSAEARLQESTDLLAQERDSTAQLREGFESVSARLQETIAERDRIDGELTDARSKTAADQALLEGERRKLDGLRQELATLRQVRSELEPRVAELAASLDAARGELTAAEARHASLSDELDAARARQAELEGELAAQGEAREQLARRLAEEEALAGRAEATERSLEAARAAAEEAQRQVQRLEQLRAELTAMLETEQTKSHAQQETIADLDRRLEQALASKIQELAKYRSEFFGQLREVLGNRPDIQIVGDRFVVQSEVLFDTGQATLETDGRQQLASLAKTLAEIAATIPPGLDWVLRVDGHTDARPIQTLRFPSNWELSTARALSVVKFLIAQGITPNRLVGAGFGEFHPLDPRDDEIAYRRNRRIEFKLTQR